MIMWCVVLLFLTRGLGTDLALLCLPKKNPGPPSGEKEENQALTRQLYGWKLAEHLKIAEEDRQKAEALLLVCTHMYTRV